jgi:hypothetical protein
VDDVVVEFGNALYQDVADRFVLGDQPVPARELAQIWRTIGDPLWDAPIFEGFYRTVRAVNWMRPPRQRIRVLLGLPAFDPARVRGPADKAYLDAYEPHYDAHIAAVTEREVLSRGRRALLVAGAGHVLRGQHADGYPHLLNAGSLIEERHPGALYVVDTLTLPITDDPRVGALTARWPRPAIAPLAGTWLAALEGLSPERAFSTAVRRYGAQANAVLYLGPDALLTASRPDSAIYHWGAYPAALHRISRAVAAIEGSAAQQEDLVALGLALAAQGVHWPSDAAASPLANRKRLYCQTHHCAKPGTHG